MIQHTYDDLIKEAFIAPIRSVLIVDDDYPTFHEILMPDAERQAKYAYKKWKDDPEARKKIKEVIEQFRTPDSPYLLDIHDGSSPSEETDEEQIRILHQTDLLVLDYQLERSKANDGAAAIRIASQALQNKHFNLILVHTQESLDQVFYQFLFGLIKPRYSAALGDDISVQLQVFLDQHEDSLLSLFMDAQYAAARLSKNGEPSEVLKKVDDGAAPWGELKSALQSGGLHHDYWSEAIVHALALFETNNLARFSKTDHGVSHWSDGAIKFIRAARGFVAFKSKDDENELMPAMLSALVAWDPRPPRLMLTKLRAEMNERGIEVQDLALGQPEVGAIWYRQLLEAKDRNLATMIDATVRHHAEQLLDELLPSVSEFAARIRAVDKDKNVNQVVLERFKVDLAKAEVIQRARIRHNAFVGSKPSVAAHLELGHIFKIGADFWACLTPACDMVPKRTRGDPYDGVSGVKRFVAVKLVPSTEKDALKSANKGGQIFANLVTEGGNTELKTFSIAKDATASPTWMTMYALDDGYLPSDGKRICSVSHLAVLKPDPESEAPATLHFTTVDAFVCGMLRYEYALEIQSRFIASQSRIGLDFLSSI